MTRLTATLVGDGPTDRCLKGPIEWLLIHHLRGPNRAIRVEVATPTTRDLVQRIRDAFTQFPCNLLFVHRDAESEPIEKRHAEIRQAAKAAGIPNFVPVVPVRMTEAWLLFDQGAIRRAADNPGGTVVLPMPLIRRLERMPDPKARLRECLLVASEKQGRHLKRFKRDLDRRVVRVAELIEDFLPLRELTAFQVLDAEVGRALAQIG